MNDENLINEINTKIVSIYKNENLTPLRGLNDSYELSGKQILVWHGDVTRHVWNHYNGHFDYNQNIDDLLFSSDEIVYFTAHLYFYVPYINTPIKDAYLAGDKMIYPVFNNLPGKRYDMYLGVVFEKVYNYWDRIGDLIASFFPDVFRGNVFFPSTIKKLAIEFPDNPDLNWLLDFVENQYSDFNLQRIDVVHYVSKNTQQKWEQLGQVGDYEKSLELTTKILSFPEYFKEMNELCKLGFEKALNFLEKVNEIKNYNRE